MVKTANFRRDSSPSSWIVDQLVARLRLLNSVDVTGQRFSVARVGIGRHRR